jgi:hypothetical protein
MTTAFQMNLRSKIGGAKKVKAPKGKAKAKPKVKAAKKTGTVNKTRAKVLTRDEIEKIVEDTVHANSLTTRAYNGSAAVLGGVGEGVYTVVEKAFSALKAIASGVWTFLGKVYASASEAVRAVINWLGQMVNAAVGEVKKALSYVKELVSSMNVDWVAVNSAVITLMAMAATIGVSVAAGILSGGAMAGVAAGLGASTTAQQVVAVLFGAVTAGCVSEVCYAFFQAGLRRELIAQCLTDAEAQAEAQGKQPVIVNAVAVS